MTEPATGVEGTEQDAAERRLRRGFIWLGVGVAVLGGFHFLDHVLRGIAVVDRGLDPAWNHSGWPFRDEVTPFTFSLVGAYLILGVGVALSIAKRAWAGYWLAAALVLVGLLVFVHLVGAAAETSAVIYNTYPAQAPALAALADLLVLVTTLLVLAGYAVRVRRASGRW